jgi:hypothetical protein
MDIHKEATLSLTQDLKHIGDNASVSMLYAHYYPNATEETFKRFYKQLHPKQIYSVKLMREARTKSQRVKIISIYLSYLTLFDKIARQ